MVQYHVRSLARSRIEEANHLYRKALGAITHTAEEPTIVVDAPRKKDKNKNQSRRRPHRGHSGEQM